MTMMADEWVINDSKLNSSSTLQLFAEHSGEGDKSYFGEGICSKPVVVILIIHQVVEVHGAAPSPVQYIGYSDNTTWCWPHQDVRE